MPPASTVPPTNPPARRRRSTAAPDRHGGTKAASTSHKRGTQRALPGPHPFGDNSTPGPSRPRGAPSATPLSRQSSPTSSMTGNDERTARSFSPASMDDDERAPRRRAPRNPRPREELHPQEGPEDVEVPYEVVTALNTFLADMREFTRQLTAHEGNGAIPRDFAGAVLEAVLTAQVMRGAMTDVVARLDHDGLELPSNVVGQVLVDTTSFLRHLALDAIEGYRLPGLAGGNERARRRQWWRAREEYISTVVRRMRGRGLRLSDANDAVYAFRSALLRGGRVADILDRAGTPEEIDRLKAVIRSLVDPGRAVVQTLW
ncbi:uncharacterized protein LOC62_03G004545 [Vanrija pseudolonga]|uniref:Uncharacterized protein n=1 Tax=Vanrija pseudolonga TaxID=143232 RepID=A0AAF0Y7W4_9TREE|nr:hypothetical protein LOC62_03G004545 [Vanrija pseudolonga]